jgi:ParB family transcriptional regulator, chromosome partitioning protein
MSSSSDHAQVRSMLFPDEASQESQNAAASTASSASQPKGPPSQRVVVGRGSRTRVAITRVDPDPRNPRAPSPKEVGELAASIAAHGMLQPIVVRPAGQRYVVVAGHRRLAAWLRCASQAPSDPRWRAIDVVIQEVGPEEALTLLLVENLQRRSLTPLQEAITLQRLRAERNWTNRQVAEAIGRSEMYVSRRLRVLEDIALREAVSDGRLPVTTAEELLAANGASRGQLVERAISEAWSPSDARRAVQDLVLEGSSSGQDPWRAPVLALSQLLEKHSTPPDALLPQIARLAEGLLAYCHA